MPEGAPKARVVDKIQLARRQKEIGHDLNQQERREIGPSEEVELDEATLVQSERLRQRRGRPGRTRPRLAERRPKLASF
jgi:hypothetical protein